MASHEILVALGRAGSDPGQILDTIVERALQLCRAQVAQLNLVEDGVFRLSRITGEVSDEFRRAIAENPNPVSRSSLVGRVAVTRRTEQIADVLDDPEYGRQDLPRGPRRSPGCARPRARPGRRRRPPAPPAQRARPRAGRPAGASRSLRGSPGRGYFLAARPRLDVDP